MWLDVYILDFRFFFLLFIEDVIEMHVYEYVFCLGMLVYVSCRGISVQWSASVCVFGETGFDGIQ